MINTAKPSSSLTNTDKVSFAETWNTMLSTWDNELRTWDRTGSLLTNTNKFTPSITNVTRPA